MGIGVATFLALVAANRLPRLGLHLRGAREHPRESETACSKVGFVEIIRLFSNPSVYSAKGFRDQRICWASGMPSVLLSYL